MGSMLKKSLIFLMRKMNFFVKTAKQFFMWCSVSLWLAKLKSTFNKLSFDTLGLFLMSNRTAPVDNLHKAFWWPFLLNKLPPVTRNTNNNPSFVLVWTLQSKLLFKEILNCSLCVHIIKSLHTKTTSCLFPWSAM